MTKNAEFFAPYCLVLIIYPKCFRQFSNAERLVTLFKVRVRSNLVALTCGGESESEEASGWTWLNNTQIQLSFFFFFYGCEWLENNSGGKDIQCFMTFRTGRNVFVCPRRVTPLRCGTFATTLSARSIKRRVWHHVPRRRAVTGGSRW